jgi:hypothetical protein
LIANLRLVPSLRLRSEPNLEALHEQPLPCVEYAVSSPIGVEGVGPGSREGDVLARLQLWRLCSLLSLDTGQAWWPICAPLHEEHATSDFALELGVWVAQNAGHAATSESFSEILRRECPRQLGSWIAGGWSTLEGNRALEQIARTYLHGLRSLKRGHIDAESAVTLFVSVFDAVGGLERLATGNSARVLKAMQRSYRRHYCPQLRTDADACGKQLHEFAYERRCQVSHEGAMIHLSGHFSGPLGDKPQDLDPSLPPLDMSIVGVLEHQARFLLKDLLGAPAPEEGTCIHA